MFPKGPRRLASGGTVSVPRRCFAARSDRLPLACPLSLLLATCAVLLVPAFALVLLPGGSGGCLCQSPQPPGDPLTIVALLDTSHGLLVGGGPVLLSTSCGSEKVIGGRRPPQSFASIVASVGRPPPPST